MPGIGTDEAVFEAATTGTDCDEAVFKPTATGTGADAAWFKFAVVASPGVAGV